MIYFKKFCLHTLGFITGCFFLVSSSLPLSCSAVEYKVSFPFVLVIDPLSHRLEKVSPENLFSILDLNILADEATLSDSEWNADPHPKENTSVPWSSTEDFWTIAVPGSVEGCQIPDPTSATWLDRLMQNAKKQKDD